MKLGFASERSVVEGQQNISVNQPGGGGFLVQMS
jgi:hypothetical protein